MQTTSKLYQKIFSGPHRMETSLVIGESGNLTDEKGNRILFGGTSILIATGGPNTGYTKNRLISVTTTARAFTDKKTVGNCISQQIKVSMIKPFGYIPRMARMSLYIRLVNNEEASEWIPRGVFFIDTRSTDKQKGFEILNIHGYDAMLKAEADFPPSKLDWPAKDIDVVTDIARFMDVGLDSRTLNVMTEGYLIQNPIEYSCREILSFIAASYGGNWIITDAGELRLLPWNSQPPETSYLVDQAGNRITFGGVHIIV